MSFDNYATAACNYPWISIGTLNGDPLGEHSRGVHATAFENVKKLYNSRKFREPDETCQSFPQPFNDTKGTRKTSFQQALSFSFFSSPPLPPPPLPPLPPFIPQSSFHLRRIRFIFRTLLLEPISSHSSISFAHFTGPDVLIG